MPRFRFSQFFSLDSAKAIKARSYGYLNAINYMAPAATAGVGNLCPHASPGCLALCLGWHSGQTGMVPKGQEETALNSVRRSRIEKARMFMKQRQMFYRELTAGIERAVRKAEREGLKLCIRLNGATDIAWERVAPWLFTANSDLQFVDYTKSVDRALAHARQQLPRNYHLTFSRSETNEADCERVLAAGGNVAVVSSQPRPETYLGHVVIDGEQHDLRFLDNQTTARSACVVWLSPKGGRARSDKSGFVVR